MLRFLWKSTRGWRLRPWRSPYLRWRIETYCGLPAEEARFREFAVFLWRQRRALRRFLRWTDEMRALSRSGRLR